MTENKCTFKCGAWNCGSYQFNLYKDDIDQGLLCDVHYWQTKAQRQWVGLTEQERNYLEDALGLFIGKPAFDAIEASLKQRNT